MVKTDPGAPFTARSFTELLAGQGVRVVPTAGDARYQLGAAERAISAIKTVIRRLREESPALPATVLMASA